MSIIIWMLLGVTTGWLTSLLLENSRHKEFFADVTLGVLGAIGAGFIMNGLTSQELLSLNWYSMALAVIGAMIVIWLDKALGRTV